MYCIVKHCGSNWRPKSDIKFHSFPKDKRRRQHWLVIVPLKGKISERSTICSLHFKPEDYDPERPGRLLSSASPYYMPQPCDCDDTKACTSVPSAQTMSDQDLNLLKTRERENIDGQSSKENVLADSSRSSTKIVHTDTQPSSAKTDKTVEVAGISTGHYSKEPVKESQQQLPQQPRQSLAPQPGPSAGSSTSFPRARDDLEEQNDSSANTQEDLKRQKTLMPTKVYSYTRRRPRVENVQESNAAPSQFGTPKKRKIDSNASCKTELRDPLSTEPVDTDTDSNQCRFCAKITKDCINATDKPYIEKNKTALTLNSLSVELDFDNDAPKVCLDCDRKLQEIFDFVTLVKAAQDSLIKVDEDMEDETETVVKIEFSSPTPEDNDEIEDEDTKEGVIDSVTIGETVFVKDNLVIHKRKCDKTDTAKRKEKLKVEKDTEEVTSGNSVLIVDIKEEVAEMDDDANVHKTAYSEVSDTGTDDKPSELDIATYALLNEMARDETIS